MTDKVNLSHRVDSLDIAPEFQPYSRVRVFVDEENCYEAGNDTGRTLEVTVPWGSQALANQLLSRIKGFQFQPYKASGALLDPAAEMGDAASIKDIYGGIYTRSRVFGTLMKADISAPHDEEIDHEFKFKTPTERKFTRQIGEARASIKITNDAIQAEVLRANQAEGQLSTRITQTATAITSEVTRAKNAESTLSSRITQNATEISAKVSQTGGNNSSFGWSLKASEFGLYAGSKKVFYANRNGAYVDGEIRAKKGTIGGFDIGATALQYNGLEWGSTNKTTGAYIGQNGIQLGKAFKVTNQGAVTASDLTINGGAINLGPKAGGGYNFTATSSGKVTAADLNINGGSIKIGSNFSVNSSGNVTANNMTLTGTLRVGGQTITAEALRQGAQSAYTNGGYWSAGAGYGHSYNTATGSWSTEIPGWFSARTVRAVGNFVFQTTQIGWREARVMSEAGVGITIRYLGEIIGG